MSTSGPSNVHGDRSREIDSGLICAAIERALGRTPVRLIGKATLAPRFVWKAVFDSGEPVYVKAETNTGGDEALVLEAWAMDQGRSAGVPVPRMIAFDMSMAVFPGPLLVLEEAPGLPLPEPWREGRADEANLDPEQLAQAWREAGAALRRLHAIQVPGYGRLDDSLYVTTGEVRGREESWADFALAPALAALADSAFVAWLPDEIRATAGAVFTSFGDVFRGRRAARLLHDDIGSKHIFVYPDGRLAAIIDWGDRACGDPAWDLANMLLWESEERLNQVIEGYGDQPGLRRRISAYALADGLRLSYKRFGQGRLAAAGLADDWLMSRFRRAVAAASVH